jgi:polyphosphate kinase
MNSLQDARMIARLYEASRAGVRIRLIVRGICCLIPQRNGWSENIEVRSIVGRFLEHARVFMFYHGGNMLTYAGSADWMTRNLNRRGEVVFPVKDPSMSGLIHAFMEWQWADNQKSRIINEEQSNPFSEGVTGRKVNSQEKFFDVLRFFEDSGSLIFP